VRGALGGKWAFHVLRLLSEGDRGFNEMKRELDGITAKTLSRRLAELRCHGFVDRAVRPTSPPSTRYSLTSDGRHFVSLLRELEESVSFVECSGCEDDCTVLTVDEEVTASALAECC
jgi:DNA-binding HxlR family transcriptional regulator